MQSKKPARLLLVARHGKSEPESLGATDHQRDLTRYGRKQVREGHEWLMSSGFSIDACWASDATRAVRTAEALMQHRGGLSAVEQRPQLYESSVHGFLNAVAEVPADTECLMVVGHQPTVSGVVAVLTGRHLNYPTGTIVAVGLDDQWAELEPDVGWVHSVFRPEPDAMEH